MQITKFVEQLTKLKKLNSVKFTTKGGYRITQYLDTKVARQRFKEQFNDCDINIKDFTLTKSTNGYDVEIDQEE